MKDVSSVVSYGMSLAQIPQPTRAVGGKTLLISQTGSSEHCFYNKDGETLAQVAQRG